jgi:hypothetical protein
VTDTDTVTEPPAFGDAMLSFAIRRLRTAEQEVAAARHTATVAKEQLALTLFDVTGEYRETDRQPPQDLLDRLYWEVRDLRQSDIARAFGMTTAQLKQTVTPKVAEVDCRSCSKPVHIETTNRTTPSYLQCDACRFAERQRERRAWAQDEGPRSGAWVDPWDAAWDDAIAAPPPWLEGSYPAFDPALPAPHHPDEVCDVCHAPPPAPEPDW